MREEGTFVAACVSTSFSLSLSLAHILKKGYGNCRTISVMIGVTHHPYSEDCTIKLWKPYSQLVCSAAIFVFVKS